ncbi:MAG: SusC/RagA family TonB-linked outer membrane protein [Bacteroidales bacterium]|nr:SusC/RagA family TonB-linked outer membrane protein [Bacteroidales bacterium]
MRKIMLMLAMISFLGMQAFAQTTITGTVTDNNGEPVPGANVRAKGYSDVGTITDLDGNYSLSVPAEATTLIFSFVGMKVQEVAIGEQTTVSVTLENEDVGIEEVIVSGVASATPKSRMTVTVAHVGEEQLNAVPSTSISTALSGKVAGVSINSYSGQPGDDASIVLRGATQIYGSQEPLIIIDGAIIEGTLSDINVQDIASIEVVKGASASALYGSRAGNGVIVITTKNGSGLKQGTSLITYRSEAGMSSITKKPNLATHHPYILADPENPGTDYTIYAGVIYPENYIGGKDIGVIGAQQLSPDHYIDNEFAKVNDQLDEFYKKGLFFNNYISVQNNSEKTNFLVSYENSKETGVVELIDGYKRNNFRINIDHKISDRISVTANNIIIKSESDDPGANDYNGGVFFDILYMPVDVDLNMPNVDGTPYHVAPNQWGLEENPLYQLSMREYKDKKSRVIGSYKLKYIATEWMNFDASYAFERSTDNYYEWNKFERLQYTSTGEYLNTGQGDLYLYNNLSFSQTMQFTAHLQKQFGDIALKGKLSYLYEDLHYERVWTFGEDFTLGGIPSINAIGGPISSSSYQSDIRAENIFGIVQADYKGKYLADAMLRYDGSSLFGENQRYHPYYRVSAAWRISEDFEIPGIDELKIRAAIGTAGQRPGFAAQYETYSISSGSTSKSTLGNKDLKPSKSTEIEVGLNVNFLKRFTFEAAYSNTVTTDQFMYVPLAPVAGFSGQWQNAGTLETNTFEFTLGADIIKTNDFSWSANLIFDRSRMMVTKLDVPSFLMQPDDQIVQDGQAFYIEEGATFGILYGYKFVTSLDQMTNQLADGDVIDNYEVNDDGYVVPRGSMGTINERVFQLDENNDGIADKMEIGDVNPDFNLSLSNTLKYKDFSLYFLIQWKQGGDIYNRQRQWSYRDNLHGDADMYGVAPQEKKAYDYFQSLYNVNNFSSEFVEDGTYVKLREVSLYYNFSKQVSNLTKGFIKDIKVGLVGRNLLTWTTYSGMDPEVGRAGNGQIYAIDAYGYPHFRTISGSIEIKF